MLINHHLFHQLVIQKLANYRNALFVIVSRKRLQVEIYAMGEVEISCAPVQHKVYQLFVLQIFLEHHVGYYLGDVVLEVVPLLVSVEHGVYPFVCQHGIDVAGIFSLVKIIE